MKRKCLDFYTFAFGSKGRENWEGVRLLILCKQGGARRKQNAHSANVRHGDPREGPRHLTHLYNILSYHIK